MRLSSAATPPEHPRMPPSPTGRRVIRHRLTLALSLPALAAVSLTAGCARDGGGALDRARAHGLRAGFSIEPPYAWVDSSGVVTGEAPEALRHGAAELGIPDVEWVPLEFPQLIPALRTGRIDVIAAGMFITPERARSIRFSRPTACVRPVLVEPRTGAVGPSPASGGARAGCPACRIAVVQGSVEETALRSQTSEGADGAEIVVLPDIGTAIAAIRAGSADALAISGPTGREIVAAEADLVAGASAFPAAIADRAAGCAAFGFRPADEDLATAFDRVLDAFIGSRAHLAIMRRFGFLPDEIPCPPGRRAAPRGVPHGSCVESTEPRDAG